jgi:hypothetical protein
VRLEVTEAILNHISGSRGGIVGVYQQHDWAEETRAALDAWAAHVVSTVEVEWTVETWWNSRVQPEPTPPERKFGEVPICLSRKALCPAHPVREKLQGILKVGKDSDGKRLSFFR